MKTRSNYNIPKNIAFFFGSAALALTAFMVFMAFIAKFSAEGALQQRFKQKVLCSNT